MSRSQVPRITELKAESTTQAQAGTMETQKSKWDGQKMGARNGKAAEEAAWVMNYVCIPQGVKSHSREGTGGLEGQLCPTSRLCISTRGSCPSAE